MAKVHLCSGVVGMIPGKLCLERTLRIESLIDIIFSSDPTHFMANVPLYSRDEGDI